MDSNAARNLRSGSMLSRETSLNSLFRTQEKKSLSQTSLDCSPVSPFGSSQHLNKPFSSNEHFSRPNNNRNRLKNYNTKNTVSPQEIRHLLITHNQSVCKKLTNMNNIFENFGREISLLKKQNLALEKKNENLEKTIEEIVEMLNSLEKEIPFVKINDSYQLRKKNSANNSKGLISMVQELTNTEKEKKSKPPKKNKKNSSKHLIEDIFESFSIPSVSSKLKAGTLRTAAKKEEETTSEYDKLVSLRDRSIIHSEFDCICECCDASIKAGEGIILHQCGHTFCQDCIKKQISNNLNQGDIKCPNVKEGCQFLIEEEEIKALLTSRAYDNRTLTLFKSMPGSVSCKAEGCKDIVIVDEKVYHFICPTCKAVNCLECGEIHADGGTCRLTKDLGSVEEQLKSFENWITIAEDSLVKNKEPFECSVCFVEYGIGYGIVLKSCAHTFCPDCLKMHINLAEDGEIPCPFRNEEYACPDILEDREIKALLSEEEYEQFLTKSVKLAESKMKNTFHCLTPDCNGWCILEDYPQFFCPVCDHLNCSDCKAIHDNLTCKQYKEELLEKSDGEKREDIRLSEMAISKLITDGNAMTCTTCGTIVQKQDGCDYIVCKCRTELCWCTKGPRWGPGGTGDISGGCRCLVNGRKCHPNCQNCH